MKLGVLSRYDLLGASSRVRFEQYRAPLSSLLPGLQWCWQPLLDDDYLRSKYGGTSTLAHVATSYARRLGRLPALQSADLLWIEKELWPWAPAWFEHAALRGRRYVLDLDDAIFHNYDLHRSAAVRRLYGRKIDRLMAGATLVTAGNDYLADRARAAGARWVESLPTVIDLERYPLPARAAVRDASAPLTVVWIGSPATAGYLKPLAEPLRRLAQEQPVRLLTIGADIALPGVPTVFEPWSADSEAASIARGDIGVMPLQDSPWERGKCGYKLIQYMACGLPVVASPVGVNRRIVADGRNGFLAADAQGWYRALRDLAADPALRARLGHQGRLCAEREYCVQVTAPKLAAWLTEAARSSSAR
jgi:glycosyltransferase involved in cell wall biosynthesis